MSFSFENLLVYKKSLDLIEETEKLIAELKGKVSFSVQDQLCRAALSIPLNIAEGNGRWHIKEKVQFIRIARGSVFEMVPIIQILHRKNFIDEAAYHQLYGDLETISKMLAGLEKSLADLN